MDAALSSPPTSPALALGKPTPAFMAVFSEQLGLIGRAFWREAAILGALFVLLTAVALWEITQRRMTVDFPIDANLLVAAFSLLMGLTVWRGEKLFDQGHLTTLPVARQNHVLIRTLAGGLWLAGIVAWALIWIAAMGLISGSDLGFDRYLLLRATGPEGQVALDGVRQFRWTPQTWHWLAPYTTAAVFYLLGCAFAIGVRLKYVWAAVAIGAVLLLPTNPFGIGDVVAEALIMDPLGLDNLLTGGLERANTAVTLPNGEAAVAWRQMPGMQAWALATGAWLALSGALLWLAAWRHRER